MNGSENVSDRLEGRSRLRLSAVFFAVACVAIFFALRPLVLSADALYKTIFRALWVRSLLAVLSGAYAANAASRDCRRRLHILRDGATAGAVAGSITVLLFAIEVANQVGRHIPEYFQWSRDWLLITSIVLVRGALVGAAVGASVAMLFFIRRPAYRCVLVLTLVSIGGTLWLWIGGELHRARQEGSALEEVANGCPFYFEVARDDERFIALNSATIEWLQSQLSEYVFQNIVTVKIWNDTSADPQPTNWRHLSTLESLRTLELRNTGLSDADLLHLHTMTTLEHLSLDETRITDHGLLHLQGMRSLRVLTLRNTAVTNRGIKQLKETLPDCVVVR